jgi:hypothetical protein
VSNYVDPEATRPEPVDLGPCGCPLEPKPHARDSAVVRARFGYGDRGIIRQAGRQGGPEAFHIQTIVRGVVSWTLLLPDGKPRPIDVLQANRLDEPTVDKLIDALDEAFAQDPLPNESGAPSPDGPLESASPTPTTPAPPEPTTT